MADAFIASKQELESEMHVYQIGEQSANRRPQTEAIEPSRPEGMFPLHRLSNICCSTGACSKVDYWPMAYAQQAWLQLDSAADAAVPVDLFAFSTKGVGVVLRVDVGLQQGAHGVLLTPAHGAGLSHRPVRCCWQRTHPHDPGRQCAGLRFDSMDQPY
jgi:hypothetical protein